VRGCRHAGPSVASLFSRVAAGGDLGETRCRGAPLAPDASQQDVGGALTGAPRHRGEGLADCAAQKLQPVQRTASTRRGLPALPARAPGSDHEAAAAAVALYWVDCRGGPAACGEQHAGAAVHQRLARGSEQPVELAPRPGRSYAGSTTSVIPMARPIAAMETRGSAPRRGPAGPGCSCVRSWPWSGCRERWSTCAVVDEVDQRREAEWKKCRHRCDHLATLAGKALVRCRVRRRGSRPCRGRCARAAAAPRGCNSRCRRRRDAPGLQERRCHGADSRRARAGVREDRLDRLRRPGAPRRPRPRRPASG
jgi:hypothetical protein